MNGRAFLTNLREVLGLTLAKGDVVIMDNVSTHKVAGVRDAIEATGAKLFYLPSYSPDLNPTEMMFAKFKALLGKAAKRTINDLWKAVGNILDHVTSEECRNYFEKVGYAST